MPRWTKGNAWYPGKGKGQGKSDLPTDLPERYAKDFLDTMDGRVRVVKEIREDLDALYAALGGKDNVSYMEQALCIKVVYIKWMTRKTELTLIQGGSIDQQAYLNAVNVLSGLLTKIGLKRRAKQLSLKDYLSTKPEPDPAHQATTTIKKES